MHDPPLAPTIQFRGTQHRPPCLTSRLPALSLALAKSKASDAWQTLSYTSMMLTADDSIAITYQLFLPFGPNHTVKRWPGPNVNFAMHVRVLRSSS